MGDDALALGRRELVVLRPFDRAGRDAVDPHRGGELDRETNASTPPVPPSPRNFHRVAGESGRWAWMSTILTIARASPRAGRRERLGEEERAIRLDSHELVPGRAVGPRCRAAWGRAGALFSGRRGDCRAPAPSRRSRRRRQREVAAHGKAESARRGAQFGEPFGLARAVAVVQGEARRRRCSASCDRRADAARGAGDQDQRCRGFGFGSRDVHRIHREARAGRAAGQACRYNRGLANCPAERSFFTVQPSADALRPECLPARTSSRPALAAGRWLDPVRATWSSRSTRQDWGITAAVRKFGPGWRFHHRARAYPAFRPGARRPGRGR